ncbi:MAG: hypothetical protein WC565_02740 [Parcubacteria group bacterium]
MLTVRVWCSLKSSKVQLKYLFGAITSVCTSLSALGVANEDEMLCLFSANLMEFGLGETILVEITLQGKAEICHQLARMIGKAVKRLYSESKVSVIFSEAEEYWNSEKLQRVLCKANGNKCNICGRSFGDGDICDGGHEIGTEYST